MRQADDHNRGQGHVKVNQIGQNFTPDQPDQPAGVLGGRGKWLLLGVGAAALVAALVVAVNRNELSGLAGEPQAESPDGSAAEARVRASPDDVDAWVTVGEERFDANDYQGAVAAYERATQLAPGVAGLWSALGEARVMASPRGGPAMPEAALVAFRRAAELDGNDPRARYFLAVQKDLTGDHPGAIADWLALLADTPQGAPWEADLRRTIEQVGARHNIDVATRLAAVRQPQLRPEQLPTVAQAIPGPTRAQMQEAASLPKGQQDMMVQSMVDGLQARLDQDPRQPDRWLMLIRSRMTLGESAKASEALRRAIAANPDQEARLRSQARLLGVPGS